MLNEVKVRKNIIDDDKYKYAFSVEEVNRRTLAGTPFRDAYKQVGIEIEQGKFEIFTTKADAIDKFMQMQGVCREELSSENLIEFYCSKKGKIAITNPPKKHIEHTNSTNLFAEIIEESSYNNEW